MLMMYYFFCPKCGHEDKVSSLPKGTIGNLRDGFGTPIYHFECPVCSNLDAGYMMFNLGKMCELPEHEQIIYFQEVISYYQGVRGFAEK